MLQLCSSISIFVLKTLFNVLRNLSIHDLRKLELKHGFFFKCGIRVGMQQICSRMLVHLYCSIKDPISICFPLPSNAKFHAIPTKKRGIMQYAANLNLCCNYAATCSNMGIFLPETFFYIIWNTTATH